MSSRKNDNDRNELLSLIQSVREGDQAAFSILLDQYRPLIESLTARFSDEEKTALHREDLRQEATVVFYRAILSYDIAQDEVEFGLYAKICISNALVSKLRVQSRQILEQPSELLWGMEQSDEGETDPSVRILEQERVKTLDTLIRNSLSRFEYRIWQLYMSGRTAREIARMVGKDEKSVTNAIYRIRKKLRARLEASEEAPIE